MSKEIDLEYQYKKYLKLVQLDEDKMNLAQKIETKRAFFGACGQMMIIFRDTIGMMDDEDKAMLYMEDMLNQVKMFWNEQT